LKVEYKTVYERFNKAFKENEWIEEEEYRKIIRDLCIRAIYSYWNTCKAPIDYEKIVEFVYRKLMSDYFGTKIKKLPSKETIKRRARETTEKSVYTIPPCAKVKDNVFIPNPDLFEGEEKALLLKFIKK